MTGGGVKISRGDRGVVGGSAHRVGGVERGEGHGAGRGRLNHGIFRDSRQGCARP